MKKIALLTLFVLIFSFCSCGSKENKTDNEPSDISVSQEIIDTLNEKWMNTFSADQQLSSCFNAEVLENWSNSVIFELSLDISENDLEQALKTADSYYPIISSLCNAYNVSLSRYDADIYSGNTIIASFMTEDGISYSVLQNGQESTTQINR